MSTVAPNPHGETFQRLTDQNRSDMAKEMARLRFQMEGLKTKKANDGKRVQAEIDQLDAEIGRICRVIQDDGEPRPQREMFHSDGEPVSGSDDAPSKDQTAAVLAKVAGQCTARGERACPVHGDCSCNGETPDIHDPACPLHGVDSQHALAPKPDQLDLLADRFIATLPNPYDWGVHETNRRFREWWKVEGRELTDVSKGELRQRIIDRIPKNPAMPKPEEAATEAPTEESEQAGDTPEAGA